MNASFIPENAEKPLPTMQSFETKVLHRLELGMRQAITRELMGVHIDKVDQMVDMMVNQMVYQVRAHVWSDPDQEHQKTYKIKTDPVFKSWKHHLIASLPEGSGRRRFLQLLWDIEDAAPVQATHTVTVKVPAVFPENRMRYPDDLGSVHYPIQISSYTTA